MNEPANPQKRLFELTEIVEEPPCPGCGQFPDGRSWPGELHCDICGLKIFDPDFVSKPDVPEKSGGGATPVENEPQVGRCPTCLTTSHYLIGTYALCLTCSSLGIIE